MPRPDVSEERRLQIVDAAIMVFGMKGYRNATMPEIAHMAGLSVGGVYWYYKSKDEIVDAILERTFSQDLDMLAELVETNTPAIDRLHAFVESYATSVEQWLPMNAIGIEFYGEATHDPRVQAVITRYLARYRETLAALIEQGIQRGELRPVNADDTATVLLGLEEGLALLLSVDAQPARWQRCFKLGCGLLIDGLKCGKINRDFTGTASRDAA